MDSINVLFLEGYIKDKNDSCINVSIETYISLFTLLSSENFQTQINFVDMKNALFLSIPKCHLQRFNFHFVNSDAITKLHCNLPLVELQGEKTVIGGLCAVLRWTIKNVSEAKGHHPARTLLGFRKGCLVSCAESSIWTKFCELDLPSAASAIIYSKLKVDSVTVPAALLRLESHLKAPVRTHNILKRKQDFQKANGLTNFSIQQNGNHKTDSNENLSLVLNELGNMSISDDFVLEHSYLEGIDFTLADVVVFPCVYFLLENTSFCPSCCLPNIVKWFRKASQMSFIQKATKSLSLVEEKCTECRTTQKDCGDISFPSLNEGSLYSRSITVSKIRSRNLNPIPVLNLLKDKGIFPEYTDNNLPKLAWDQLPLLLHPSSGELPEKRILRKCQQLENMVSAVTSIVSAGDIVVDFCSGGGHVGLLLAYLLPSSQVLLVENKEDSLLRARKRARALKLENIHFYQSNLDYFNASFDVGVSLHACGLATDLVIDKCLKQNASFVCCPCCYGTIQETDCLKFPLSKLYQSSTLSYKDYITISRCADRTENNTATLEQGIYCMGLVDKDRACYAEELGYEVQIMKMDPTTCSPKHNLLIGKKSSCTNLQNTVKI